MKHDLHLLRLTVFQRSKLEARMYSQVYYRDNSKVIVNMSKSIGYTYLLYFTYIEKIVLFSQTKG